MQSYADWALIAGTGPSGSGKVTQEGMTIKTLPTALAFGVLVGSSQAWAQRAPELWLELPSSRWDLVVGPDGTHRLTNEYARHRNPEYQRRTAPREYYRSDRFSRRLKQEMPQ